MAEEFNPAYYSEDELMTRHQLAELTGVSISKINKIINLEFMDFPKPLGKIDREFVYFKSDILAWLETHDVHDPIAKDGDKKSMLDNRLANRFIMTRLPGMDD